MQPVQALYLQSIRPSWSFYPENVTCPSPVVWMPWMIFSCTCAFQRQGFYPTPAMPGLFQKMQTVLFWEKGSACWCWNALKTQKRIMIKSMLLSKGSGPPATAELPPSTPRIQKASWKPWMKLTGMLASTLPPLNWLKPMAPAHGWATKWNSKH